MKHLGKPHMSITNCLQTGAVNRNRNAPCVYTYVCEAVHTEVTLELF